MDQDEQGLQVGYRQTLLYGFLAFLLIAAVSAFYFFVIRGQETVFAKNKNSVAVSDSIVHASVSVPAGSVADTGPDLQKKGADILFVGDMFFDRHIRQVGEAQGGNYIFSCIDPLLQKPDFVVGNLEGPITSNASVSVGSVVGSANNYRFTFPTSTAALLRAHGVQVVTLGNNHITNFGLSGLLQTHAYLDQVGVGYFGGVAGNEPVYRKDDGGVPLSFVGYNQFGGASPAQVALTILGERAAGRVVIVFAHWGTEYSTTTEQTRPIATLFAESGASVVIGSHPHVVGVHEYIGSTLVYYSLGNFIFDQYFNAAVTHGLALLLHVAQTGEVAASEYPTELERDGRTCPQRLQ